MKAVIAAALTLALAGCLSPDGADRVSLSRFRINPDKTFTYSDDAVVEAGQTIETTKPLREWWLKDWLADNNLCPNGYRIIQASGARTGGMTIWGGSLYKADFTGRCL